MLSELPPVTEIPTSDFNLVPLDFYPPQNKLNDALFSVWCVFQQLQKLKEAQSNDIEKAIGDTPSDYTKLAERYDHNLQRKFTSEKPSTLRNET